jgi:SAM-dependent methyltransferase
MLRSVRLFRLFLKEQSDPGGFYAALAGDAADQLAEYAVVRGQTVLDIGGGAGYFTEEFRSRGANCYLLELTAGEMMSRGETPPGAVIADGYWLPVRDGGATSASLPTSSSVRDPNGLIEEMVRATRPGGLIYPSFTNWYSPWAGMRCRRGTTSREPRRAPVPAKHGKPPKNRVGSACSNCTSARATMMRRRADVEVVSARPRYYPAWCALCSLPGLRGIACFPVRLFQRPDGRQRRRPDTTGRQAR